MAAETILRLIDETGGIGGGGGGSAPAAPGGGASKKMAKYLQGIQQSTRKSLGATLGIKLGTASILKQSQVFTGFIGTIFQLMGALVDVILAPFLPILIPGIKLIAKMIPYVSQYAQNIFDFLDRTLFQWLRDFGGGLPDSLKNKVVPALSALLVAAFFLKFTGLWNPVKTVLTEFIGRPLWGIISSKLTGLLTKLLKLDADVVAKLGLKAVLKQTLKETLKAAGTRIVTFVRTQLNMRMNTLKGLFRIVQGYLEEPIKFIKGKVVGLADFLARPFAGLWDNIGSKGASFMDNFALRFLASAKTWVAELPIVAAAKSFFSAKGVLGKAGGLLGRAAGAVKGKAGGAMKVLGTSMKGVPVLGAVAELGFGAYQTYQDYQKYGMREAVSRGLLTAANVGTALIDPTGIASAAGSIGSNIAMSQVFKNNAVRESWALGQDQNLIVRVENPEGGYTYYEKKHFDASNFEVLAQPGMSTYRATID